MQESDTEKGSHMRAFLEWRSWVWAVVAVSVMLITYCIFALAQADVCGDECGLIAKMVVTFSPFPIPFMMNFYMTGVWEPWRSTRDADRWMNGFAVLTSLGFVVSFATAVVFSSTGTYLDHVGIHAMKLIFVMFAVVFAAVFLTTAFIVFVRRWYSSTSNWHLPGN